MRQPVTFFHAYNYGKVKTIKELGIIGTSLVPLTRKKSAQSTTLMKWSTKEAKTSGSNLRFPFLHKPVAVCGFQVVKCRQHRRIENDTFLSSLDLSGIHFTFFGH